MKASCRGDECCIFLVGGKDCDDEVLALELVIYMKEKWKVSDFCKRIWQASATGLITQVDVRIGIGAGDVALDNDIWSGTTTPEGIAISEAKRIEGLADEAKETLIVVKWDIKETCVKANVPVKFGEAVRLKGKGIPTYHDIPLYPVLTYERWKDIQAEVTPSPKTVDELYARAVALSQSGDIKSAIRILTNILSINQNYYKAFIIRGNLHYVTKKYNLALNDFNQALKLWPDDPNTLQKRGSIHYLKKKYKLALDDFDRALNLWPGNPDILSNRRETYEKLGEMELAFEDHYRALTETGHNPGILYNMACHYSQSRHPDEAIVYLEQAINGDKKYRSMAKADKDFDNIRQDQRFRNLVEVSKSN